MRVSGKSSGGGGHTRSARSRGSSSQTRGSAPGGTETGGDEELLMVQHMLAELHDFRGADGVETSDWVIQVCVTYVMV
jgi:hypothetical protein